MFLDFANDIRLFILQTLFGHDIIVGAFGTYTLARWFDKGIDSFWRECPSVKSALMILILSFDDLLVAEVFHGIFVWAAHLHLFDEFLLPGDSCESLVLPCGKYVRHLVPRCLVGDIVEELVLIALAPVELGIVAVLASFRVQAYLIAKVYTRTTYSL